MMKLENYSEFLPICDDYEILLRTALNTKIVKIMLIIIIMLLIITIQMINN